MIFAQPSVAALNHLLAQNSWASRRLIPFSGRTARFDVVPFSLSIMVLPDGMIGLADPAVSPSVRCSIAPSLLPRLALQDERACAEIDAEGDAEFIAEIRFLLRNLRWDAAEDLSKVSGDIVAERIVQGAKGAVRQIEDTALNLTQAVAEYCTEEQHVLVKPDQIFSFKRELDSLREDIARLEQRVGMVESSN